MIKFFLIGILIYNLRSEGLYAEKTRNTEFPPLWKYSRSFEVSCSRDIKPLFLIAITWDEIILREFSFHKVDIQLFSPMLGENSQIPFSFLQALLKLPWNLNLFSFNLPVLEKRKPWSSLWFYDEIMWMWQWFAARVKNNGGKVLNRHSKICIYELGALPPSGSPIAHWEKFQ